MTYRTSSVTALASNQMLEAMFQSDQILAIWLDNKFSIVRISQALANAVGCEPAKMIGRSFFTFCHDQCLEALFIRAATSAEPNLSSSMPLTIQTPEGAQKTFRRWSMSPVRGEDSSGSGLLVTISGENSPEIATSTSNDLVSFLETLNRVPIALGFSALDGCILGQNRWMRELVGYTDAEIVKLHLSDMFARPEQASDSLIHLQSYRDVEDYEGWIKKKDGTVFAAGFHRSIVSVGGKDVVLAAVEDISDRKRQDQALKESEEHYRSITETSLDAIWQLDMERNIVFMNQSGARMFGYTKEEITGMKFASLVPANELDRANQIVATAMAGKEIEGEITALRQDGRPFPISFSIVPVKKNGRVVGIAGTTRNITQEKSAQDRVAIFQSLAENAVDAIAIGKDGHLSYANDAWYKLFGYNPLRNEAVGFPVAKAFLEEDKDLLENQIIPAIEHGGWEGTIRQRRKDGSVFIAAATVFAVKDSGGDTICQATILCDVTDQKRAEQQLRESRDQLRTLIDSTPSAIYIKDLEGRYLLINREFELIVGMKQDELIGKTDHDFFPVEGADNCRASDRRSVAERQTITLEEEAIIHGKTRQFISTKSPLIDSNGKIYAVCGVSTDITDIRIREEDLRRVSIAASASVSAISITDSDGVITYVNESFVRIWGYGSADDVIGLPINRLVRTQSNSLETVCEPVNDGARSVREMKAIRRDGSVFDIEVHSQQLLDAEGKLESIVFSFFDIGERNRMEQKLRQSEESLSAAQRVAGVGSWDWNIITNELQCSDESYRIFGLTLGEFGATYDVFLGSIHPDDRKMVTTSVDKAINEHAPYNIEYRIVHPDGSERIVNEQGEVTFDGEGKPIRMIGTVQDITDRKKAEEELRFQAQIIDQVHDSVISTDLDGFVNYWSKGAERMHGYTSEETLGKHISILYPEEAREALQPELVATLEEKGVYEAEVELLTKSGERFFGYLSLSMLRDSNGQAYGIIGLCSDITKRKSAEEEQQKIKKLESIGVLAGRIAHDFNNVLVGVLGNIALAKSELESWSQAFRLLSQAEKSCSRAAGLTQRLLTFAEGGTPVKEKTKITDIIGESAEFVLSKSLSRCVFDFAPDLFPIEVDPGQISQVVQNIVLNADQAMPEGGNVRIGLENIEIKSDNHLSLPPGKFVKISISDRGEGIDPKIIGKIFDPFFTTREGRVGLGLATCHSIVEKHGGHIAIESKLAMGTTVNVYLPMSEKVDTDKYSLNDSGKTSQLEPPPSTSTISEARILLMDDEPMIRDIVSKILSREGYQIDVVEDGDQAIERFKTAKNDERPYDLVIFDLSVPGGMGGKEILPMILDIDTQIKSIVCSGYANDPVVADPQNYGFTASLSKPFKAEQLLKAVRKQLTD